jgi:hypothetical protein
VLPGAAALGIGALAAYLVWTAVNVGMVVAAGGYLSAVALPIIAVGGVTLVVGVSFGLAIGRWLPFVLIPPLLVVYAATAVFLGDTEAYTEGPNASFEPPGWMLLWGDLQVVGTEFDFAAVTAGTHLGQGLWAVALATAGLIVFATARLRTRAAAPGPPPSSRWRSAWRSRSPCFRSGTPTPTISIRARPRWSAPPTRRACA